MYIYNLPTDNMFSQNHNLTFGAFPKIKLTRNVLSQLSISVNGKHTHGYTCEDGQYISETKGNFSWILLRFYLFNKGNTYFLK